jgi:hypothetical protein
MTIIVSALGVFYLLAAALVLRRARMEWFQDRALERSSGEPPADRYRLAVIAVSAVLYGVAGMALVVRSGWAVWLLGAGFLAQALYYGALWLRLLPDSGEGSRSDRWRKAWNAAIISAAAFALAAYAHRIGVLA